MKPTRSRVFCAQCKKQKILFESEAKAKNFIKYNSEEILEESGVAPTRAYYCTSCGGWHVTHSEPLVDSVEKKLGPIYDNTYDMLEDFKTYCKEQKWRDVYLHGVEVYFRIVVYKKIAEHLESEKHLEYIEKLTDELEKEMYNAITTVYQIAIENDVNNEVKNTSQFYTHGINIGCSALGFFKKDTESYNSVKWLVEDMRQKRSEFEKRMRIEAEKTTPLERLVNKMNEYVSNVQTFLDNHEFFQASKHIHFAVLHLNKHQHIFSGSNAIVPIIDKLLEQKKQIPEEYNIR
jgi:predicted transcriptional regulator